MFCQKKNLLEKVAAMKRCKYLPLDKESKAQTDIAKKQYQKLDNTDKIDRVKKEKPKCNWSNLIYNSKHIFSEFYNTKILNSISLESQYPFLLFL